MYLPKSDIFTSLESLGYPVSQIQPTEFNELPAITFNIINNSINPNLDNEILSQEIEVAIDIWAEDSVTASNILFQVEEIMRNNQYNMSYSNDVPNIGNLYHIYSRFTKLI